MLFNIRPQMPCPGLPVIGAVAVAASQKEKHIGAGRRQHEVFPIAAAAERYGTREIRVPSAQTLIIPNVKGLVSWVGNDYCNLAVIETKSRAVQTAKALEARLGQSLKPITMHWSGCPAGCGNHLVADIGLLGKKTKINGQVVEAVDIFIGGRSGPDPKPALKLLEDVPCDKLADVLGGIVPFHTREKMHRQRGTAAHRPGGGKKNGDPALAEAGGGDR